MIITTELTLLDHYALALISSGMGSCTNRMKERKNPTDKKELDEHGMDVEVKTYPGVVFNIAVAMLAERKKRLEESKVLHD